MLDKIIDKLKKKAAAASAPVAPETKRLAAAALMVEAARRDNDFAADERAAIKRVVGENFKLTPEDAETLVELAEQRQKIPYGESIFTRTVAGSFSVDERKEVLRMIWEVALADGHLDHLEDVMIARLASEIGLDKAASDAARTAAEAKR
jgi:uncharacterized tellurite resistance protein B-like protein